MATNWVSQNGTAAWNSSSAGNPCSIAVMNSNISPGDTAYLLTGSFTSRIKPVKSGTSDTTRIRIVANVLDGVADEEVTGTHKSSFPDFSSAPQPCIDFSGLDFVTVSGIKLDGTFLAPSSNLPEANIVLGNTNNCIGKHLVYANTGGSVIGSIHETGPHSDCQFLYCDLSYVGNWKITNPDLTLTDTGVHIYSNSAAEAKRLVLYKNNLHWGGSRCIDIKGHDCFILENSIRNDWEYIGTAIGELLAGDYAGNLGADIGSSGTAGGTNTGVRNRFIKNVIQHTARSIDNADVEALKLSGNQTIARGNVVFDHKAGQAITSTTGSAASAPATNMRISHNTIAYINGSGWGLLANNKPGSIAETGNIFKNNIVNNVVLSPLNARSNLTSSPYKSYPIYLVDLITYAGLDKFGNNKIISNLLPANCEVAFSITDVDTITNLETTFGTNVSGNIQSDTPGFVNSLSPYLVTSGTVGSPSINVTLDTFEISSSSPAYLSAEEETNTVNSGTGTKITVADASWFHDGGASTGGIISSVDGITVQPDIITIGNNSPVNILAINYSTNQIDVDSPITWNSGDPVRLSNYLNIGAWQAATVEGILARPNVYAYPNNTTWPLQLAVLDNDIDINGSSPPTGLIVSSVIPGIGCHQTNTKINAGDNTVVDFEPLAGFIGEARFTYTAYDSINDLSSTTTVSVNISQASTGTGATLVNDTFETNGYLNGQIESVSGNSWKASVGTTSSTVKKWYPGHYVMQGETNDAKNKIAQYDQFVGAKLKFFWKNLEPTEGVFDFSEIEADVQSLWQTGNGKRSLIMIGIKEHNFSKLEYTAAPDWLGVYDAMDNVWLSPPNPDHPNDPGAYYYLSGSSTPDPKLAVAIWKPWVREKVDNLFRALGEAYDNDDRISFISLDETALSNPPADITPTPQEYLTGLIETEKSLASHFPKTPALQLANFISSDEPGMLSIFENMESIGGGISGPDLFDTYLDGDGLPKTQAYELYPEFAGRIPLAIENQRADRIASAGPAVAYDVAINSLSCNVIFWNTKFDGDPNWDFYTGIIPVLEDNNWFIHTDRPSNLSTPTTPITLNWQPGHFIKQQDNDNIPDAYSFIFDPEYTDQLDGVLMNSVWGNFEDNVEGVYDWSLIDLFVNFLKPHNKKLIVSFNNRDFSITTPVGTIPRYILTNQKYGFSDNYQFDRPSITTNGYYGVACTKNGFIARFWDPVVQDRYIELLRQFSIKYQNEDTIVGVITAESAEGFKGIVPSDFDIAVSNGEKYRQEERVYNASVEYLPKIPTMIGANHGNDLESIIIPAYYSAGCGQYEPDFFPTTDGTTAQLIFDSNYRTPPKNHMARCVTVSALTNNKFPGITAQEIVQGIDDRDYNFVAWVKSYINGNVMDGNAALIAAGKPINTIIPLNMENRIATSPTTDTGSVVVSANRVTHTAADVGAYINSKATTDRVLSVDLDFKNDLNNTIKIFPCRTNITDFDASSAEAIEVRINGGNGRIVVNHFDAGGLRTQLGGPWTIPIPIGQINVKVDWDPTNNIGKVLIDDISIGTFSQPEPPGGAGAQSFHPGHYVKAWTDQIKEDWAWIFSEPNVIGVMWEIAWNEIENDAGTAYDFTKLDENYNYLAAQGKYSIIELRDRHFEENNPNNTVLPTYLESPTYGGGYWVTHKTKDGVCIIRGICAVLWNSNLMDRYIALIQAVGAHMNGKPFFEGLQGGESSIGFGCEPSDPNYSPEGYVAQLKRQLDAGVAAVPNHWYALGGNFINDAGTSSTLIPELVDYMVANGGAIKEADLHTDFGGRSPTPFQLYIYDNYVGDLVQSTIGSASALDNDTEEDLWNWVMDPAHGITHACWNGTWWKQTSVLDRINAVGGVSGWMQCPTNIDCLGGGTGGTLEICNLPYTGWYVTNIGTSALTLDNYNITQASGGTTGITITQATIDGDADFGIVKHNSAQITHDILALGYFTNPTGGTVTIQQPTGSWNTLNCTVTTNGSTILFDPGSNVGSYSYTYTLRDSLNNTATGVVSGTLGNTLPVPASNVFLKASKGGSTFVNPKTGLSIPTGLSTGSAWAADADGDTLVYAQSVAPAHGSLSITSSGIEYTHDNSSNFFDSFVLTVYDGFAYGNNLNVNVQISGIQANNDIASIPQNAKYDGTINSKTNIFVLNNDIGTNLTIYKLNNVVQTTPIQVRTNHGYVIRNSNYVIYQPDTDYIGQDSFTYEIVDASSEFSSATVTINVYLEDEEDPNSQIIVTNDTYTIGAGTGLQVLIPSPLSNDIVVNVNRIITETYTEEEITETTTEEFLTETTATYSIGALSNIFGGSFNIINNGADVDFTPTIDSGIATATYEIYGDGFPLSPPVYGNIYITVEPQLYAPDVTMSISALPGEETEILINAADLVYSALTGPQVYSITAQPALGSAIIDPNTGIITYTITTSVNWSDTIVVRVTQDGIIVDFTITLLGLVKTGNQDWLETDNNKIILVEAGYHNGTETSVGYFGTFPYILKQGDSFIDIYGNTVNSIYYDEIVNDIPEVSSRIDLSSTIGAIELLNPEGDLDELLKYGWEGHPLKIYLGDPLWTKEQFILIFDGIINKFTSSSVDKITIDVRDKDQILSVSVQSNTITLSYVENILASSTFTADTKDVPPVVFDPDIVSIPESIVNTPAPICLGYCFNISPKLIDAYNHVYQIHDGSIQAITEVRSNGAIVDAGDYEVDLSKGCFRLLVHDLGQQITCDVIGQSTRSSLAETSPGVYPYSLVLHSAAHLIEWLLLEKTSVTIDNLDPDSFDPNGVNGFPNTSVMGLYIEDEEEVKELLNKISSSVGAFIRFNKTNNLVQLTQFKDPATQPYSLELPEDQILENGLTLSDIEIPKKNIKLSYKKNWTVQDKGALAGIVVEQELEVLENITSEYKIVNVANPITYINDMYPLLEEDEVQETLLYNKQDALNEANRRIQLRKQKRFIYSVQATAVPLTINVGSIIKITHFRFDFSSGKKGLVIGINEDPINKFVTLEVWI